MVGQALLGPAAPLTKSPDEASERWGRWGFCLLIIHGVAGSRIVAWEQCVPCIVTHCSLLFRIKPLFSQAMNQKKSKAAAQTLLPMTAPLPIPGPQEEPHDPRRIDRVLGKLGLVWRRVPDWQFVWLVVNLGRSGVSASDAEIEVALDRLLGADLG